LIGPWSVRQCGLSIVRVGCYWRMMSQAPTTRETCCEDGRNGDGLRMRSLDDWRKSSSRSPESRPVTVSIVGGNQPGGRLGVVIGVASSRSIRDRLSGLPRPHPAISGIGADHRSKMGRDGHLICERIPRPRAGSHPGCDRNETCGPGARAPRIRRPPGRLAARAGLRGIGISRFLMASLRGCASLRRRVLRLGAAHEGISASEERPSTGRDTFFRNILRCGDVASGSASPRHRVDSPVVLAYRGRHIGAVAADHGGLPPGGQEIRAPPVDAGTRAVVISLWAGSSRRWTPAPAPRPTSSAWRSAPTAPTWRRAGITSSIFGTCGASAISWRAWAWTGTRPRTRLPAGTWPRVESISKRVSDDRLSAHAGPGCVTPAHRPVPPSRDANRQ